MSKSFENIVGKANGLIEEHNKEVEQKWGIGYNSDHEFHSVLREEVEEVGENFIELKEVVEKRLWDKIRADEEIEKADCELVILLAKQVIAEAVQVGAVAMRCLHKKEKGSN